jgi:hypothetical protein
MNTDALFHTATIRDRAKTLLSHARAGQSAHWRVNDAAIAFAAQKVAEVTRSRYPDLDIPFHSRWRHFEAGGRDRAAKLTSAVVHALPQASAAELARARIDLAVVSVLLDAGAGPAWAYTESTRSGTQRFNRSEGLGVASFQAFMQGVFSSDAKQALRVDAQALQNLSAETLASAFQASDANPLLGLGGRLSLMHRLGDALAASPDVFGKLGRPGGLFEHLAAGQSAVSAHDLLSAILAHLGSVWPTGQALGLTPLGDCWNHSALGAAGTAEGRMPFHKLSQWLTYSLLEPFQWAGIQVTGLDELTGLPEYRNGGLMMDSGILRLADASQIAHVHKVSDELVVEWRALTVALMDELAPLVRTELGLSAEQMPLASVLEGGTWATGRLLATQLRGGEPPLKLALDGTVF